MQRLCSLHRQLTSLTDQLKASNADLQIQSLHDPLTGLTNRRGLDIRLDEELRIARRERQPLTLILCDVDNFKSYNDTAGHLQGDQCLVRIAQLLGETCRRPRDLAARFGGEEFVILMPGTSHSGAMFYAKGLQRMVHQLALPHPASDGKTCVTLSGGITTCVPDGTTTIESLLSRADAALYTAKSLGRDRFFCFETQADSSTGQAELANYDREKSSTAVLSARRRGSAPQAAAVAAGLAAHLHAAQLAGVDQLHRAPDVGAQVLQRGRAQARHLVEEAVVQLAAQGLDVAAQVGQVHHHAVVVGRARQGDLGDVGVAVDAQAGLHIHRAAQGVGGFEIKGLAQFVLHGCSSGRRDGGRSADAQHLVGLHRQAPARIGQAVRRGPGGVLARQRAVHGLQEMVRERQFGQLIQVQPGWGTTTLSSCPGAAAGCCRPWG
jgi:diguanylate cyclase (GGDEF)-like protein